MKTQKVLICALALSLPLTVLAETSSDADLDNSMRARMADVEESQVDFREMIDTASEVYSSIVKGPHGEVPEHVLTNARCIAVIPKVVTGALVLGATHGEGLASCKNEQGSWSQPAAIALNQASIGLQAGAKSTDLLLFFETEKSASALKSSETTLGSDVSAVAGTYDSNVDTSKAGVLVYSRTKGAFAGVSLNGGTLKEDTKNQESYYGKKADYKAILEGREMPDESKYTEKLTSLFPA